MHLKSSLVLFVMLSVGCNGDTEDETVSTTTVHSDPGLVITGQGWLVGTTPSALDATHFGPTVAGLSERNGAWRKSCFYMHPGYCADSSPRDP